ncbi:MAG TPA: single-stranded-DNA-specific exonuclease RecJ [Saprospiraceae bacterium]|nr:single-stranded-DNA-specific exonuclease RecJ [Saprospiraceae bacterium]
MSILMALPVISAMKKQWKYKPVDTSAVQALQVELGVNATMAKLLYLRGVKSKEQADKFFNPSFDDLHDPYLLKDMDLAISRLETAISKGQRILLYGDYDVDGVTSVSLLYSFLKRYTEHLDFYIPDRYKEGYGLTLQGVDYAKQNDVKLLITMDCGTTALTQIQEAKAKGIDVIVLDHHLPVDELPPTVALINPKQTDCPYPFKDLSGCGVTFKFAQAYAAHLGMPRRALIPLLDFVATSIACDYVPIVGENRILATFGLHQINHNTRVGLKALIARTNYTYPFSISDIVFGIGPYINAAGRLSDGKEAVRLLLAEDWLVASEYANILRERNTQRRIFDRKNLAEAIKVWESNEHHSKVPIVVLFQANWHKGVLGIVASRMAKHYHKPAVIMCESNGEIVASARSTPTIDIHELLKQSEHLLTTFGGHPKAAGFSMPPENLEALTRNLLQSMQGVSAAQQTPTLFIDSELELKDITPKFMEELHKLAPLGPGNPNPLFVCENVEVAGPIRYIEKNSIRLLVAKENSKRFKAVGFRKGDYIDQINSQEFAMCFKIIESVWKGEKQLQLQMKDIFEGEIKQPLPISTSELKEEE